MTLPYLAGFADGEGCLMILPRRHSRPNFTFAVVNTDIRPLKEFKTRFGGVIHQLVEHRPRREPRIVYRYSVQGKQSVVAVKALQPHFVVKREQARVFLRGFIEITSRAYGDRRIAREKWLIGRMSLLKKR